MVEGRDKLDRMLAQISEFSSERDWDQFHTVRSLVLALVGEVGELAAEIQWISDGEMDSWLAVPSNRARFETELADVLSYFLLLTQRVGVDIPQAFDAKLAENRVRYAPDKVRGRAVKYNEI